MLGSRSQATLSSAGFRARLHPGAAHCPLQGDRADKSQVGPSTTQWSAPSSPCPTISAGPPEPKAYAAQGVLCSRVICPVAGHHTRRVLPSSEQLDAHTWSWPAGRSARLQGCRKHGRGASTHHPHTHGAPKQPLRWSQQMKGLGRPQCARLHQRQLRVVLVQLCQGRGRGQSVLVSRLPPCGKARACPPRLRTPCTAPLQS